MPKQTGMTQIRLLQMQGRRRFLESGTAIERQRRSARAGGGEREGGEHERGHTPSRKGGRGISPEKIFKFNMSVEAILMHFETIFACEIRLIVQTVHIAVF